MSAKYDHALSLVANGYSVFPVSPTTKRPATPNGFYDATRDGDTIYGWFADNNLDVAVPTGELVVLDIDNLGTPLPGPVGSVGYETPRGGRHVLYRAGGEYLNNAQDYEGRKGIDRRAHGGYVRVPLGATIPPVESLPLVPEWFTVYKEAPQASIFEGSVKQWMETVGAGEQDGYVRGMVRKMVATEAGEFNHQRMVAFQVALVREGAGGRPGTGTAISALRDAWCSGEWADDAHRHEFDTALAGAISKWGGAIPTVDLPDTEPIAVVTEESSVDSNPIKVLTLSDLRNRPKAHWWIGGILKQESVCVVAGPGGVGKTFLVLDWSLRMAGGHPDWHGRKVKQAKVLYVAAEGIGAFIDRAGAWSHYNKLDINEDNIRFIESNVNLAEDKSVDNLIERIQQFEADIIVLDTFSQLASIDDENKASEVAGVMRNAQRLRRAHHNATVILVHHAKKDGETYRGSSAIRDNVDTLLMVRKQNNGTISLSTDADWGGKQRDGDVVRMDDFMVKPGPLFDSAYMGRVSITDIDSISATLMDKLQDGGSYSMETLCLTLGVTKGSKDFDKTRQAVTDRLPALGVVKSGSTRTATYSIPN